MSDDLSRRLEECGLEVLALIKAVTAGDLGEWFFRRRRLLVRFAALGSQAPQGGDHLVQLPCEMDCSEEAFTTCEAILTDVREKLADLHGRPPWEGKPSPGPNTAA